MNPGNTTSRWVNGLADPRNATTLRCDAVIDGRHCGAPPFAVAPGSENIEQSDLFILVRGIPARTWCRKCWLKQFAEAAP